MSGLWVLLALLQEPRDFEFHRPASIKGLQVQSIDDAIALGVKHAALNISLAEWIDADGNLIEAGARRLDAKVRPLTAAGINVFGIVLNYLPREPKAGDPRIHPRTDPAAPNRIGAFNTSDDAGRALFRRAMQGLAERYSRPDAGQGWISGYVIGNEVQAHSEWYNLGAAEPADVVREYASALRIADEAVRGVHAKLRVFVSMEHHWSAAMSPDLRKAMPGRRFLDELAAAVKAGGDFPWGLAFHPYPENLFEPRTWRDRQARPDFDTPKITFRNLELLPRYLAQERFGGKRRIILSEQGFHTPDGPDGESLQAAGYAWAWARMKGIPEIEAFILHRHVDHAREGGLRLGLWTRKADAPSPSEPDRRKRIYDVFRLCDTPDWGGAFDFALPLVGIRDWSEALPR